LPRYLTTAPDVIPVEAKSETPQAPNLGAMNRERERDILEECLRGHPEPYGEIVQCYQRRLFGLLLRQVCDRAAAEDLTQEAFLLAFRKLHLYDLERPFWPWLVRIGLNLGYTWHRSARRQAIPMEAEVVEVLAAEASNEGDPATRRASARRLERALQALPEKGRVALLLKFHEGMSYREMSQALGVPALVLKMRVSRARARLRALLEASEAGAEGT
jgi:RNA polymerase sigma-70 factor, ECF subfamily